jgi:hypothetical protein
VLLRMLGELLQRPVEKGAGNLHAEAAWHAGA